MAVEENILNNDEIFVDTVDKPKEGVEQQRKQECLRGETSNGKVLGGKRKQTQERVDKTINKIYEKDKQHELKEKRTKESLSRQAFNQCVFYTIFSGS